MLEQPPDVTQQSLDPAVELVRVLRKLTPAQRRVLKALPEHGGQLWGTLKKLGHGQASGHRWMRNRNFVRARELLEQRAIEEIGITHGYVLGRTKDVVERCMQEEPVLDHEGKPTGEYRFEHSGALKGLEMLGRYRKTWGDESAKSVPIGPGLTVIVQQGDNRTVVQAGAGAQGSVVVDLPGPE